MELKELCERTLEMFSVQSVDELGDALFTTCKNNDFDRLTEFADMVEDLSIDWLQMIYQYFQADRKDRKQDFTPKSLARFCGKLVGDDNEITDLCAGSGAMTIQKWNMDPETSFKIYEIDENVIPYLIFNMMLRNIDCAIYQADVLLSKTYATYKISKGERFGEYKEVAQCQA